MRNKIFGKQFSRGRKGREALLTSLLKSVTEKGSITTTLTKAKAVQPDLEKLILYVAKNDVPAKRAAYAMLGNDRQVAEMLFARKALATSRKSGFTTITRLPHRKGDGAEMARIGWVTVTEETQEKVSKKSDKSQVTSEE